MSASELERYLHCQIQLTRAMGIRVVACGRDEVRLSAPLAPNLNHHQTAFGGSIAAVATAAAWSLMHVRAQEFERPVGLVIRSCTVEYLAPVAGNFEAVCHAPTDSAYARYLQALNRRGKGRIELNSTVYWDGNAAATFTGTFVAIRDER